MSGIINFPTELKKKSVTVINNIFIDIPRMEYYIITPIWKVYPTRMVNY
jgi:hypothetical protein